MADFDDLFSGNLDSKMDFLNEKKQVKYRWYLQN
jgi:hypothetical protein